MYYTMSGSEETEWLQIIFLHEVHAGSKWKVSEQLSLVAYRAPYMQMYHGDTDDVLSHSKEPTKNT